MNHEAHEAHKDNSDHEPLPPNVERLINELLGAAIAVHRALGPGFVEKVYVRGFVVELRCRGIKFVQEAPVTVTYRGETLCDDRLDLLVEDAVVVEIKAVKTLRPIHEAQLLSYMRASKKRAGLLFNFNEKRLIDGFRRFVR